MIIQFVESYTSNDRQEADLTTRVMRVDTGNVAHDAHGICGGSTAYSIIALIAIWKENDVYIARGYGCSSFSEFSFRSIVASGSFSHGKLKFSDENLHKLGLAGKMLADEMLVPLMSFKDGMPERRKRKTKGEYWQDKYNWRVRDRWFSDGCRP